VLKVLMVRTVLKVLVLGVRTVLKVLVLQVLVLQVLVVLAVPSIAAAQDAPRGYIQGTVGMARSVETDSAYAGLGAWRMNGSVHLFGEVGRLRNAIGHDLQEQVAVAEEGIRAYNERAFHDEFPVVFEARVPTWYGFGGVRVGGPSAGRLSIYLEGGAGSARLDPQVHLTVNGERLDNEVAAITGLEEGRQQLEFLAGGGAGVAVQAWRRIRIEGGYRYMRLFGDAKTNIHHVHVGGGWTF
jgi:opacity protein-like surface antigen